MDLGRPSTDGRLRTAEVYSARLETLLSGLFHKTDVLESVIIAGHGHIPETVFEDLARSLADGAGIRAIQYLPDGVVTYCYPREGNEAVIGTSRFTNPNAADALLASTAAALFYRARTACSRAAWGWWRAIPFF